MPLRISNVRLRVDEPEALLPERLARALGLPPEALLRWRILRKSLDARDKDALQFVYTAEVSVPEDEARLAARAARTRHPAARAAFRPAAVRRPPGCPPAAGRPVGCRTARP